MKTILAVAACAAITMFAGTARAQGTRPVQTFKSKAGPIKITPVNHASMVIEAGGKVIIVDPAKPANFSGLPKADLVLVTDIHGDHLDVASIAAVSKPEPDTDLIAPAAVVKLCGARNLDGPSGITSIVKCLQLDNGQKIPWGTFTVEAVPMYNLVRGPAPGKFFHDKGRGNGYIITYGGTRIYISGDTEATPEMRALKNIDVAFICMNGPTMTPEEAAEAVKAFHPKVAIPYHYRGADPTAFQKALNGTGIDVRLLDWYPKS
jgi:L-ascorbate metabolism protein UlaG (beta-lactamase superfamily)